MRNLKRTALTAVSLLVAACATEPQKQEAVHMIQRTTDEVTDTVQQPFEDFNVVRDEIPIILFNIRDNPYAEPVSANCRSVVAEIRQLDRALGADLDTREVKDRTAVDATFSLARGLALGLIPFRGVAREVTGAEAHSHAFNTAVLAGTVRRAYLKGIGERLGCSYPGSPHQYASDPGD